MSKITYWLRKLGILRTSAYKTKDVNELNKMNATDGNMMQNQKEIDEKYKDKNSYKENKS